MRTAPLRAAALAAALVWTVPAAAQTPPALRAGQAVQGMLAEDDPSFVEFGRFRVYRFDAAEGQTYILTLRSTAFDALLSVARPVGGLTEIVARSDDSGEGTDSRLRWRAPATGTYLVVAQSLTGDGVGAYTLAAERAPEPTTAAPRPIRPGESVSGALAETDAVQEADGSFYDTYTLQGRRGQRLRIVMRSGDFDTYLAFAPAASGDWSTAATDDDGLGEGTDSQLRVTLPADGTYHIRANSVGAAATGAYTLTVAERAPARVPVAAALTPAREVQAALEEGDGEDEDGSLYDLYRVDGRVGQRVVLRMESDRFDTFLVLGRMAGGRFEELASNDDADEGTNSVVEATLPADGEYLVRARALHAGAAGPYRIGLSLPR